MSRLADAVRALGHRRWFARIGRALVPADRLVGRLTKGRFVALGLRGLPSMLLSTTGRRTGLVRTQPLLYAPEGDGYVVVGSNWGQPHQPAWALNLVADPVAVETYRRRAAASGRAPAAWAARCRVSCWNRSAALPAACRAAGPVRPGTTPPSGALAPRDAGSSVAGRDRPALSGVLAAGAACAAGRLAGHGAGHRQREQRREQPEGPWAVPEPSSP